MGRKVWEGVRIVIAVVWLLGSLACGFFQAEVALPEYPAIAEARQRDRAEWSKLDSAYEIYQTEGLRSMESFLEQSVLSIRAEILVQDLRSLEWSPKATRDFYERRYLKDQDARSAYLLSRVIPIKAERKSMLDLAKKLDPLLLQARVDRLSLEPYRVGNDAILERLLKLLNQDPGLAEGWRLLREIASVYGKPGLACQAADLEPWSPSEDSTLALLDQVRTCIAAGKPEVALQRLQDFGLQGKESIWLEAAALARMERAQEAWVLLQSMLETWPDDPMIHFNLALLARDYLGKPELAKEELEMFLKLAEKAERSGNAVPYFRLLQARIWLREEGDST
jgi:tetratricopeptide (TPR) repeat protein